MKKYTIAKNEKELHNNYKVIARKYFKKKKSTLIENLKQIALLFWYAIRLKDISDIYEQKLCGLYFEEIELYYLNNDFSKRSMQIENAYLKRQQQRRYGIIFPVFLSILASLIYGVAFSGYLGSFWTVLKNMNEMLHKQQLNWIDLIEFIADYRPGIFIFYPLLLVTMVIILVWLIIQVVNLVGYFIGGPNTNRAIAEQYRQGYLENLISCDKYFELTEILSRHAETFSSYLEQTVNQGNLQKDITMESFEKEVEKEFFDSENIEVDDEMIKIWGKSLISKSIIYRSFLSVERKGKKLSDVFQQITKN